MESQIIYEICAIVATLILIVIAAYLVMVLRTLSESLKHLNSSLSKLNTQIDPISNETVRLLENANEIAESFQDKLANLDPLMGSISNVGSALQNATDSFSEERTGKFFRTEKKTDWQSITGDLIKLATVGVMLWQKLKKEK